MTIKNLGAKRLQGLKLDRVSDSLGSSADGVNTNVTLDTTNEKLGTGCYNFDGSGDKVAIGTSTTLSSTLTDGSSDWTIAFWMKLNAIEPNGNNAIFCQGQGNEQGLDILFDDRSAEGRDHVLGVRMEGVGGHTPMKLYTGAQFIAKDTDWHHYVITGDVSTRTVTAYRDGANAVSDSTGSGTFPSAGDLDAPMTFGYHPSTGFGDLNAKLDDCGIWSRILTSAEIQALVNQGATTNAYKPSTMVIRSSDVYDPSSQTNQLDGLFFKPDGLKMYIASRAGSSFAIYQYTLSTAFDLTTASYASKSFDYTSQFSNIRGMFISNDGVHLYTTSWGDAEVNEYTLSTAWDISTASHEYSKTSDYSSSPMLGGITFKTDGTRMYHGHGTSGNVRQYDLSTAWDLSTASSSDDGEKQIISNDPIEGLWIDPNGKFLLVSSPDGGHIIKRWNFGTDWDVETLTDANSNYQINSNSLTYPRGMAFNSDGSKILVCVHGDSKVHAWDVGTKTYDGALVSSLSNKSGLKAYYSMDSLALSTGTEVSQIPASDSGGRVVGYISGNFYAQRVGVEVSTGSTLIGLDNITAIKFRIGKTVGSPTGDMNCKIYNSSGTLQYTSESSSDVNVANLSTTVFEEKTFTFDGTAKINSGDRIVCEGGSYSSSGHKFVEVAGSDDTPLVTGNRIVEYGLIGGGSNTWDAYTDRSTWIKVTGDVAGCKNDYSSTSALDALTGIRTNTIFEQTDTDVPTYYWYQTLDGVTAWFPTFAGRFVAGDWTAVGGGTASTNEVTVALDTDGNQDSVVYDLGGIISDDKWVLDFTLNFSRLTVGTNIFGFMGLSSISDWVSTNTSDSVGMMFMQESATKVFASSYIDSGTWNGQRDDSQTWTPSTGVDYYFRVTRINSTNLKVELFPNSSRTTPTSTSTRTITGTGLRYIHFTGDNNSGNGNATYTISNMKFFNGVSSV